jgi:hypothetical protein
MRQSDNEVHIFPLFLFCFDGFEGKQGEETCLIWKGDQKLYRRKAANIPLVRILENQCWGSGCFWASWIRIH